MNLDMINNFFDCVLVSSKIKGIKKSEYKTNGRFPIIDQGQNLITAYSDKEELVENNIPFIVFGDHTRVLKYIDFPSILSNDGIKVLRTKSDIDIKFLYYQFLNFKIPNTGYNRHFKYLIENNLVIPKIKIQEKIALVLSSVDEEIKKTEQIIEKTEKLKNGLMFKFFSGKFKTVKLGDYVDIRSGDSPSNFKFTNYGDFPFYKVEDMNQSQKYLISTRYHFSLYKKPLMPNRMVVFPKRGEAIYKNKIRILSSDAYFDTNIMGLITKDGLLNEYLYYLLIYIGLSQFADTTSIPQINNKHIDPLMIPLPKEVEQNRFVQILKSIDEKIAIETKYKEKLIGLKHGLMYDIFSQKVEVKNV